MFHREEIMDRTTSTKLFDAPREERRRILRQMAKKHAVAGAPIAVTRV